MIVRVGVLVLALVWGSSAGAEEAIRTAGSGQPPVAPAVEALPAPAPQPVQDRKAQEIGDWARGVLEGRPSAETEVAAGPRPRCEPPLDRKPHGEVWVGVGSEGYREVGAIVSQPIGDCARLTVEVNRVEGRFGSYGPR